MKDNNLEIDFNNDPYEESGKIVEFLGKNLNSNGFDTTNDTKLFFFGNNEKNKNTLDLITSENTSIFYDIANEILENNENKKQINIPLENLQEKYDNALLKSKVYLDCCEMGYIKPKMNHDETLIFEDLTTLSNENSALPKFNRVKIYNPNDYGLPFDKNKINVLAEYKENTKEDFIFNILNDKNNSIKFNGKEIDWNPISVNENENIEKYLKHLIENKEKIKKEEKEKLEENIKDLLYTKADKREKEMNITKNNTSLEQAKFLQKTQENFFQTVNKVMQKDPHLFQGVQLAKIFFDLDKNEINEVWKSAQNKADEIRKNKQINTKTNQNESKKSHRRK